MPEHRDNHKVPVGDPVGPLDAGGPLWVQAAEAGVRDSGPAPRRPGNPGGGVYATNSLESLNKAFLDFVARDLDTLDTRLKVFRVSAGFSMGIFVGLLVSSLVLIFGDYGSSMLKGTLAGLIPVPLVPMVLAFVLGEVFVPDERASIIMLAGEWTKWYEHNKEKSEHVVLIKQSAAPSVFEE